MYIRKDDRPCHYVNDENSPMYLKTKPVKIFPAIKIWSAITTYKDTKLPLWQMKYDVYTVKPVSLKIIETYRFINIQCKIEQ
jgi:hypothetical protein